MTTTTDILGNNRRFYSRPPVIAHGSVITPGDIADAEKVTKSSNAKSAPRTKGSPRSLKKRWLRSPKKNWHLRRLD